MKLAPEGVLIQARDLIEDCPRDVESLLKALGEAAGLTQKRLDELREAGKTRGLTYRLLLSRLRELWVLESAVFAAR